MSRIAPAHCAKCGRIPPQPWSRTTAGNGPAPSGLNKVPSTLVVRSALWKLTLVAQPDRVMMALMKRIKVSSRDFLYGPIFEPCSLLRGSDNFVEALNDTFDLLFGGARRPSCFPVLRVTYTTRSGRPMKVLDMKQRRAVPSDQVATDANWK